MSTQGELEQVVSAVVCLRRGSVLSSEGKVDERMEGIAAAASELLLSGNGSDFAALFASLDGPAGEAAPQEVMLISARHVHVVRRCRANPETALVAVAELDRGLGLVLSDLRRSLLRLESTR